MKDGTRIISAIYEGGLIHPLESLNLYEHQKIKIQIIPETQFEHSEDIIQFLIQIGLLTPPKGYSHIPPVTEEERGRLADIFAQAASKPLSEIIIEEREQQLT
ncbi:MAG: antitoxin family protein [Desulfobacterales bacterium]|nr:antitoxin family protein [Desulfobacterales bacterium]